MKTWSEQRSGHFHLEVALSGGVDSVVLLHVLLQLQDRLNCDISAVHVNHQLQAPADGWVVFCQKLCEQWQVPLRVVVVDVENTQQLGVEAAARKARYRVFADSTADAVVLAHHGDDQVETAMLALLRGGGLRAMAAMPAWRALTPEIRLWRPLLALPKQAIVDYASTHALSHVEDPSNLDPSYLRNWLRQQILPSMLQQRPELGAKIQVAVAQMQQELAVLDEIQQQDWHTVHANQIFQVNKYLQLSRARQEQQLLYFAKKHQLGAWKKARLIGFLEEIVEKPQSRHHVMLSDGEIWVDRGRLFAWGEIQRREWAMLVAVFDSNEGKKPIFAPHRLALFERLVNTQNSLNMRLVSLAQLRSLLSAVALKPVVKAIKQAKIPLFLTELWPCWYDETQGTAVAAWLTDAKLRTEIPDWNGALLFLQQYVLPANQDT